ncbi:TetR/AcrR family transcriptional regulator [Demequina capsici]|uniref:TetR/AcrR family transcriptional regulator n=1 Tax=Demequina capsici TaxID=3075620 RepID=A0AA96FF16_9MICO|nr:TetR/AcrR family transcriptional regulator [Demequina sp. PMTSA13]WNM28748.1 TetR/AcrR family transcriptional regulator [Demequina sp. PMTSA13]
MTEARPDGRDTRWEAHRAQRRRELVSHALRAIRAHGASVGMDEIATRAGTSKTVVYRHFGDRAGLYAAVVDSVHDYIHAGLTAALEQSVTGDLTALIRDLSDAYLRLVERDPEIYRFVLHRPPSAEDLTLDPAGALTDRMGHHVADAVAANLVSRGLDPSPSITWGHGLVGFIRAAADQWMASEPRPPRDTVVADITTLFSAALSGVPAR